MFFGAVFCAGLHVREDLVTPAVEAAVEGVSHLCIVELGIDGRCSRVQRTLVDGREACVCDHWQGRCGCERCDDGACFHGGSLLMCEAASWAA